MYTYEDYLKEADHITWEECGILYEKICSQIDRRDETCMEIWDELMGKAARYANERANWLLVSREERMERDEGRTKLHNSLIVSFHMLARYMEAQGKDNAWRDELGEARKRIGDFACYLVFVYSLTAR